MLKLLCALRLVSLSLLYTYGLETVVTPCEQSPFFFANKLNLSAAGKLKEALLAGCCCECFVYKYTHALAAQ